MQRLLRYDEAGGVDGYGVVAWMGIEEVAAVVAGGGLEGGFVLRPLQTDDGVGDDRAADVGDEAGEGGGWVADGETVGSQVEDGKTEMERRGYGLAFGGVRLQGDGLLARLEAFGADLEGVVAGGGMKGEPAPIGGGGLEDGLVRFEANDRSGDSGADGVFYDAGEGCSLGLRMK